MHDDKGGTLESNTRRGRQNEEGVLVSQNIVTCIEGITLFGFLGHLASLCISMNFLPLR